MKTLTGILAKKYILDPIHGPIPLTKLELEIISTPVFQRLRNITQLSLTPLVFPGATHNRFLHSLGTLQVMDKFLYNLSLENKISSDPVISERIIQKMRISALLHDCGHLPFSHTFENFYEGCNHEDFGKYVVENSIINECLQNSKIQSNSIGELITGHVFIEDPDFIELTQLLPLLHSDADADRMDYLLRDAYFTGVPYGKIDIDRLTNFISKHNGMICFKEKAQDALENFLFSRYQMYKIVYIHKTVVSYDLLIRKLYKNYIEKYFDELKLPFYLPKISDFKSADKEWINNTFCNLHEKDLFKSIQIILGSTTIEKQDKDDLTKLYSRIIERKPIKNCFKYDNLAEASTTEYCEKEISLFEELRKSPNVVDHWSFLRHDPSKPLKIASPLKGNINDDQDLEQIRILKEKPSGNNEIYPLQDRTNSVIKSLTRHHRILISYYHDDKESQELIKNLANKYIS